MGLFKYIHLEPLWAEITETLENSEGKKNVNFKG